MYGATSECSETKSGAIMESGVGVTMMPTPTQGGEACCDLNVARPRLVSTMQLWWTAALPCIFFFRNRLGDIFCAFFFFNLPSLLADHNLRYSLWSNSLPKKQSATPSCEEDSRSQETHYQKQVIRENRSSLRTQRFQ